MRQVLIYAALLAALLLGAWLRWTAEPDADDGEKVVLLAGDADQLETIAWKSDDAQATIERKTDAHGDYVWVTHVKWEERKVQGPKLPEPGAEDGAVEDEGADAEGEEAEGEDGEGEEAAAEEETERIERKLVFKASAKGDELVADFSPLLAIRKLEAVADEKLEEIGLTEATESLVVTRKGKVATLTLGGEAYGTRDRYVRWEETGDVYLLDDQIVKSLEYARTRLPDRSLWSFEQPSVAKVVISSAAGSVEAVQKNPDDAQKAKWVKADGETEDEQLETWVGKVIKLKGTSYVDPDSEDAPQDLQARFSLKLVPAGKGAPETLEVLQDGDAGDFYGRSEHTRGLVKMLRAPTRAVAEDVDGLVAP